MVVVFSILASTFVIINQSLINRFKAAITELGTHSNQANNPPAYG